MGELIAPDMVALRLSPPLRFLVVGSPDYLRNKKRPERIADLSGHACLRMRRSNGAIAPWSFLQGNKAVEATVFGPFIASDFAILLGAAMRGAGLAQLPEPIAAAALKGGKLVPVLESFAAMTPGMFFYYPKHRQMPPKLRAFIDHVKKHTKDTARHRS